jgi:hypothetical protein
MRWWNFEEFQNFQKIKNARKCPKRTHPKNLKNFTLKFFGFVRFSDNFQHFLIFRKFFNFFQRSHQEMHAVSMNATCCLCWTQSLSHSVASCLVCTNRPLQLRDCLTCLAYLGFSEAACQPCVLQRLVRSEPQSGTDRIRQRSTSETVRDRPVPRRLRRWKFEKFQNFEKNKNARNCSKSAQNQKNLKNFT